jgi:hypothetical protein
VNKSQKEGFAARSIGKRPTCGTLSDLRTLHEVPFVFFAVKDNLESAGMINLPIGGK